MCSGIDEDFDSARKRRMGEETTDDEDDTQVLTAAYTSSGEPHTICLLQWQGRRMRSHSTLSCNRCSAAVMVLTLQPQSAPNQPTALQALCTPPDQRATQYKGEPMLHAAVLLPVCLQGGGPHVQLDLQNHRGKVTEWLQNEPVQGEIRRQFKKFLRTFKDDNGDRLYVRVIENMVLGERQGRAVMGAGLKLRQGCSTGEDWRLADKVLMASWRGAATMLCMFESYWCCAAAERSRCVVLIPPAPTANKQSLEVDWRHMHLMPGMRPVAAACADAPREVLRLLDVAAAEAVFDAYPEYEEIHQDIHVRITGLPVDDSIRDLR